MQILVTVKGEGAAGITAASDLAEKEKWHMFT